MVEQFDPSAGVPVDLASVPDLVRAAKALAAVMAQGQPYEEAARRIMAYDSQPYPVPYVFMSMTVAAFLRALGAAEEAGVPTTGPTHALPSYGPALRESI